MSEPRLAHEVVVLTAVQMPRTIARIAREIIERNPGDAKLTVVGIHTRGARSDGYEIRTTALRRGVPSIPTLAGALAAISAIEAARRPRVQVHRLQDLHRAPETA